MRRDAARNQQLILRAAQDVFSEHGPDAAMELIAAHAGVGVGTIYRHYPTKDSLMNALASSIVNDLAAVAQASLDSDNPDGLQQFLRVLGTSFAAHRGYAAILMEHTSTEAADKLRKLISELTEQSQRQGSLQPWATVDDVMALIWATRGIIQSGGAPGTLVWQRHINLCLSALRAQTPPS